MLILDRRKGEKILVGETLSLTLTGVADGVVSIEVRDELNEDELKLELNLRKRECVNITPDIKVCIINIASAGVSIGVEADRDVPIHREEVNERIRRYSSKQGRKPCG